MALSILNNIEVILRTVQERLDSLPDAPKLKVDRQATRQEEDWLYVVVTPTQEGVRAYDYVKALSDVEQVLRRDNVNKVVLVPALED